MTISINIQISVAGSQKAALQTTTNGSSLLINGCSGSGKTLILHSICGALLSSEVFDVTGSCRIGDYVIDYQNPEKCKNTHDLGFIPQSTSSGLTARSIEQEICNSAFSSQSLDQAISFLSACGLSDISVDPFTLSGGQQRLLLLAAVIASNPQHLIVDGGFVSLDIDKYDICRDYVSNWMSNYIERRLICASNSLSDCWWKYQKSIDLFRNDNFLVWEFKEPINSIPIIRYENVSLRYPKSKKAAVSNVSFCINQGEVIYLRGQNGSGKSTLFRALSGYIRLETGRILYKNLPIEKQWPGLKQGGVAYIPQEADAAVAYAHPTKKYNLAGDVSYWTQSPGMRYLSLIYELCKYLPELIILDEPTTHISSHELLTALIDAKHKNHLISIVIITHDDNLLHLIPGRTINIS